MAKSREEMKHLLKPVYTYKNPATTCGCGRAAKYLVYEDSQPHCQECFEEAISSKYGALVRSIEGGWDDAS